MNLLPYGENDVMRGREKERRRGEVNDLIKGITMARKIDQIYEIPN